MNSTKHSRPWWWWINPWLFIERRDHELETAIRYLYETARDIEFPKNRYYDPARAARVMQGTAGRCRSCGLLFIKSYAMEVVMSCSSTVCKESPHA